MRKKKTTDATADSDPVVAAKGAVEATPTESAAQEPQQLLESLTAKNSDYIHAVTRQLMLAGKPDEEIKPILADILPQILEAQKQGTTARTLLGTPMSFVAQYKSSDAKKAETAKNTNMWLMLLDSFLLIFSVFSAVSGVMMFFQKRTVYGLVTLIAMSLFGALALYVMYRVSYAPYIEGKAKLGRMKGMLFMVAIFVIWMGITLLITSIIPIQSQLNLDPITLIAIAAVAFGGRYFLKSKLNIQPSLVPRAQIIALQDKGKK